MKKLLLSTLFIILFASFAKAQNVEPGDSVVVPDTLRILNHYKFKDNWFINGMIGANHSIGENARHADFVDMFAPSFAISAGKYFSPSVGARLQFTIDGHRSRANEEMIDAYPSVFGEGNYKYKGMGLFVDGMFNLCNLFSEYKEDRFFNIAVVVGIGMTSSFGFEKEKLEGWNEINSDNGYPYYPVNRNSHVYLGVRAGLTASFRLSECVDLNLEAVATGTDDGFDGFRSDRVYDGFVSTMVGVTYRFKNHDETHQFTYVNLSENYDDLNDKINQQRARISDLQAQPNVVTTVQKQVQTNQLLGMTVSFNLDKYNITDIQKRNVAAAAKYLERHPDVNLIVTGYADVQTGNPAYNKKLSKRRAEEVRNALVNEFKVLPERVRVDYKGDTVQPYQMKNEWNRVVVFITEPRNK